MNILVKNEFEVLHMTQALRDQLMNVITDADLAYRLPGANVTLGELCREMGEVQQSYIDSFKTFKQDFTYRYAEAKKVESSVQHLGEWFKKMDAELDAVLQSLSDAEIESKMIDRGYGMVFPVGVQFHVYREALLIFYGKASLYLRALNKALPEQWQTWIG